MADWLLRLSKHRLGSNASLGPLAALDRVIYCVEGGVDLRGRAGMETIAADQAWSAAAEISLAAGETGATLLHWEIVTHIDLDTTTAGRDATGAALLTAPVSLPAECLMRCDRVEFPPGGVAYPHIHRGPGIRCLLTGRLTVTVGGQSRSMGPLEAWFEDGSDPVYAEASPTDVTAFVRVMILPLAILGRPSIRYVDDADRDKPKPQRYTVYVDRQIQVK